MTDNETPRMTVEKRMAQLRAAREQRSTGPDAAAVDEARRAQLETGPVGEHMLKLREERAGRDKGRSA